MHQSTTGAHPKDIKPKSAIFIIIQALSLALAIYALGGVGVTAWFCLEGAPGRGTLSADLQPSGDHLVVSRLGPGSPLAAAGIHPGDAIRFDRPADNGNLWQAGEKVGITRLGRAESLRTSSLRTGPGHVEVTAAPVEAAGPSYVVPFFVDAMTTCFSVLMGVLLVIRARGSKALLALGFAFIVFDCYASQPLWFDPNGRVFAMVSTAWVQGLFANIGFVLFVGFFYSENIGPVPRWAWGVVGAYLTVWTALSVENVLDVIAGTYLNFGADLRTVYGVWDASVFGLVLVGLLLGWRRSRRDLQRRYALLCLAISLVIVADFIFDTVAILLTGFDQGSLLVDIAQALSVAGHALFAYAALRHRVVDLSFATNRVLVYGGVSTLLLVAFGLIEWAFEHFLPIEGREKNAFIDAGLALVVFLTFHRVRDFVEHHVEALFFHAWQRNEAKLRTFVAEAAFVTKPEALTLALVEELQRFTGGASVAFYWQTPSGDYGLLDGAGDTRMDGDDATLVTLRATGKSVEISEARKGWSAGLAIPVIMRADLMGFIALGAKPSGAGYRPDEMEVLGWAVQQIGLDLHTRRVQQLEQANQVLEIKYNELKSVLTPKRAPRSRQLVT